MKKIWKKLDITIIDILLFTLMAFIITFVMYKDYTDEKISALNNQIIIYQDEIKVINSDTEKIKDDTMAIIKDYDTRRIMAEEDCARLEREIEELKKNK